MILSDKFAIIKYCIKIILQYKYRNKNT